MFYKDYSIEQERSGKFKCEDLELYNFSSLKGLYRAIEGKLNSKRVKASRAKKKVLGHY